MVHDAVATEAVGRHQDFVVLESGGFVDDLHAILQIEDGGIKGIVVFLALDGAFHGKGGNQRLVADGLFVGLHFNFVGFVEQSDEFVLGGQHFAFLFRSSQRDDDVVLADELRHILVDGFHRKGREDLAEQHVFVFDAHQRLVGEEVGEDGVEVSASLLFVALIVLVLDLFHQVSLGAFKF